MANIFGTTGDDSLHGTVDSDVFEVTGGGDDTVDGLGGDDTIHAGGALTAADRIDGGEGHDIVYLGGTYAGLVLEAETLVGVESILFSSSGDLDLTFHDGNIAAGVALGLNAAAAATVRLDASAETDGRVWFEAGVGDDYLAGGAGMDVLRVAAGEDTALGGDGADTVYATGLTRGDRLDGGGGEDLVILTVESDSTLRIGPQIRNVERIGLDGTFDVAMRLTDAVADGFALTIGPELNGGAFDFDGSAEKESSLHATGAAQNDTLTGGRAADVLAGSDGDDRLTGGRGADDLRGEAGADTYVYQSIKDTTRKAPDTIAAFGKGDIADLSAIDADVGVGGDQAFVLVGAFTGVAGQAMLSFEAGEARLSMDVDGDGKADGVIVLGVDPEGFGGFVL